MYVGEHREASECTMTSLERRGGDYYRTYALLRFWESSRLPYTVVTLADPVTISAWQSVASNLP